MSEAAQQVGNGRAFSRARREALSRGGKSRLGTRPPESAPARKPLPAPPNAAASAAPRPAPTPAPQSPQPEPAIDLPAVPSDAECGCQHAAEAAASVAESVCDLVEREPAALGEAAASVRALCRERRNALSGRGKAALPPSSGRATRRADDAAALTGRDAARQHRAERCASGRGDIPACRPTGRIRPRSDAVAPKVEIGTTLSGATVTGTQVERSARVTGSEPGSCRVITGTEYIGAEQYGDLCGVRPQAGPAKVGVSPTRRGQVVTGSELGRSRAVTGDEAGTCKHVTGTDYLTNEPFKSMCRTQAEPPPARLGMTATRGGVKLTGTLVGRAAKVTGDEPGSCKRLTGTQYTEAEAAAACEGVPPKVPLSHTGHGTAVTGTTVGHAENITGHESGASRQVTGTEYVGPDRDRAPAATAAAAKGASLTWGGQRISGTQVGRSVKVTGDEHGACSIVTGSSYIPRERYEEHCDTGAVAAEQARTAVRRSFAGQPLTGIQPGPDAKLTGVTRRGTCQPVSGTPYLGTDQVAGVCREGAGTTTGSHHRILAPADAALPLTTTQPVEAVVPGAFSVISPAQDARLRASRRPVTGTAYGVAGRITGPVALATGLVTGTAEFRYRDDAAPAAPSQPPATQPAAAVRERITGEGRDVGIKVTGDDWARSDRVTGTEGLWAKKRNPSWRGGLAVAGARAAAEPAAGAPATQGRERPEAPQSRITGSSGNSNAGAVVTLSGGARG